MLCCFCVHLLYIDIFEYMYLVMRLLMLVALRRNLFFPRCMFLFHAEVCAEREGLVVSLSTRIYWRPKSVISQLFVTMVFTGRHRRPNATCEGRPGSVYVNKESMSEEQAGNRVMRFGEESRITFWQRWQDPCIRTWLREVAGVLRVRYVFVLWFSILIYPT